MTHIVVAVFLQEIVLAKQKADSNVKQPQEIPAGEAGVTPVAQEQMIAVAAYYRAEQRGFSPDQELEDWLQAEKEIESRAVGGGSRA